MRQLAPQRIGSVSCRVNRHLRVLGRIATFVVTGLQILGAPLAVHPRCRVVRGRPVSSPSSYLARICRGVFAGSDIAGCSRAAHVPANAAVARAAPRRTMRCADCRSWHSTFRPPRELPQAASSNPAPVTPAVPLLPVACLPTGVWLSKVSSGALVAGTSASSGASAASPPRAAPAPRAPAAAVLPSRTLSAACPKHWGV
jgi:hypothetical protein